MNLEQIKYHLSRIEFFERSNLDLNKAARIEKDKKLKAKIKSKIKYNESMIKHSKNMIEIYEESSFDVKFNHNYE